MRYFVNAQEMKAYDHNTVSYYGVPEIVLMEQAANAFVHRFLSIRQEKAAFGRVLVLCGNGNNGTDGIAIARLLNQKGVTAVICPLFCDPEKESASYRTQLSIYRKYGYAFATVFDEGISCDYIIDAIFGIGLSREITGETAAIIHAANQMPALRIAVDIPSGISADNGRILGTAVKADYTITFSFAKTGHYLWPGCDYCGKVCIEEIGITEESFLDVNPGKMIYEESDLSSLLPKRPSHSHKGTFGRVLVIAGSRTMAGAAFFSAKAAYCMGSGIVKIFTAEENRQVLLGLLPEAIIETYSQDSFSTEKLKELLEWADAAVIGPGIGTSPLSAELLLCVLSHHICPLVLDADALNLIASHPQWTGFLKNNCVITPHLGEMARLLEQTPSHVAENLLTAAVDYAVCHHVICVLKDAHTVTADWNGLLYLNLTGNPGMATAGSGDVLTGIIASLLGQGLDFMKAASAGVFLHGKAGDEAVKHTGTYGLMAEDLLQGLLSIWKREEEK